MKSFFYIFFTVFVALYCVPVQAQQKIPRIPLSLDFSLKTTQIDDSLPLDTLELGPVSSAEWDRFTSVMGKDFGVGFFLTLPDFGFPFRPLQWVVPFYGGSSESGQLAESGIKAELWVDATELQHVKDTSPTLSSGVVTIKTDGYMMSSAVFEFSGGTYYEGPFETAMLVSYQNGPDTLAVSPIWTTAQREREYFYMYPLIQPVAEDEDEGEDDDTEQPPPAFLRNIVDHNQFWNDREIDPSVFGEMAGILIVEINTIEPEPDPDTEDPEEPGDEGDDTVGTGLREEWVLPGSHNVIDNFPNPFNPQTTFRIMPQATGVHQIQIFDILGRSVHQSELNAHAGQVVFFSWDASALSSGVYWISVSHQGKRWIHSATLSK